MVKFRGKPKPRKAAAPAQPEVHAYSAPRRFSNPFGGLKNVTKRQKLFFGIATLIITLVVGVVLYNTVGPGKDIPKGISEKQGFQNYLSNLEANPPSADASKIEQANYYRKLSVTKADVQDYNGAIEAFRAGEKANSANFNYVDYMYLARYYNEIGDKGGVRNSLIQAENVLPAADDPGTGYYRADQLEIINHFRKLYGV